MSRSNSIPTGMIAPLLLLSSEAFQPPSSHYSTHPQPPPPQQQQQQQHNPRHNQDPQTLLHYVTAADAAHPTIPSWVPMELIELAAEEQNLSPSSFISQYADVEAYTSCDDEGDDLHECDFFGQYLGPTKWLHLTPEAQSSAVNQVHFQIWKDAWKNPHSSVDVAEKVSQETFRHYNEFMLEPRTTSTITTDNDQIENPKVRIKVIPASFGLEGFEDAVWEATEDLLLRYHHGHHDHDDNNNNNNHNHNNHDETPGANTNDNHRSRKAITFVVASPDLLDPKLSNDRIKSSPQAEFNPDGFREFASTLFQKLKLFSKMEEKEEDNDDDDNEGVVCGTTMEDEDDDDVDYLEEKVALASFHPQWRGGEENGHSAHHPFPYPCVAISTEMYC